MGIVNRVLGNALDKIAHPKIILRQLEKGRNSPNKFAAGMLVTTIVSKDLVGCALYTTQSLKNKKIPPEKRKFVASLDLMNGILMVGGQLVVGKLIENKLIPKLTGKTFTGTLKDKTEKEIPLPTEKIKKARFETNNITELVKNVFKKDESGEVSKKVKAIRAQLKNKGIDYTKATDEQIKEVTTSLIKKVGKGSSKYEAVTAGFSILIGALMTTALIKRTVVPLISTPLAGKFKAKFLDKKPDKKGNEVKTAAKEEKLSEYTEAEMKAAEVSTPWNKANIEKTSSNLVSKYKIN